MYDSLRNDGLPIASLMEFLLTRSIVIDVMEDNAAAEVAAENCDGPRLRHLHRVKRIHVGYLGEVFDKESPQATSLNVESKLQKGDILTKEMDQRRFE